MSESILLIPYTRQLVALGECLPWAPCHHAPGRAGVFPGTLSRELILLSQKMDQPLLRHNYHLFLNNTLLFIREVMAIFPGLKYYSPWTTKESLPSTQLKNLLLPPPQRVASPITVLYSLPIYSMSGYGLFWFHLDPAYKFSIGFQRPCPTGG